jgi:uncharacterized protein YjiS (DUF1127 family)
MRKAGWPYTLEPYPYAAAGGWGLGPGGQSLITWMIAAAERLCATMWRKAKTRFYYERYMKELSELDDRMLKDIGLDRGALHRVAMEGAVKAAAKRRHKL